jgi:hypothetical protein
MLRIKIGRPVEAADLTVCLKAEREIQKQRIIPAGARRAAIFEKLWPLFAPPEYRQRADDLARPVRVTICAGLPDNI